MKSKVISVIIIKEGERYNLEVQLPPGMSTKLATNILEQAIKKLNSDQMVK